MRYMKSMFVCHTHAVVVHDLARMECRTARSDCFYDYFRASAS